MVNNQAINLIDAIRRSRKSKITIGKFTFLFSRPTDVDFARICTKDLVHFDLALEYVDGWEGVTEADLVESGASDEVVFNKELWREFAVDQPKILQKITEAIVLSYSEHVKALGEAEKN